jgi:glycosyltransferase domain-containing protein
MNVYFKETKKMIFAKNVTIIIPTLNRSDFILKMLRAFNATNFGGKIIIGDSSDNFHYKKTDEYIRAKDYKYEINQYPLPGMKAYECIVNLHNIVETPFVIWMCDDDILVPSTLDKAAKYLNENKEYSAVGGVGIVLGIDEENYDFVIGSDRYWLESIEHNSGTNRLLNLGRNYQVISYSLCRTEQFISKFKSYVNYYHYQYFDFPILLF